LANIYSIVQGGEKIYQNLKSWICKSIETKKGKNIWKEELRSEASGMRRPVSDLIYIYIYIYI